MEVEPAAAAGAVQRLAHKVKARAALELEPLVHFVEAEAAAGGLGLLPAAGGQPLEPPALDCGGELRPRRSGQGAGVFGQSGVGPEGAAQLRGQKPQPELRCAAQKPGPPGEEGGQLRFAQGGEEVEGYDGLLRAAARKAAKFSMIHLRRPSVEVCFDRLRIFVLFLSGSRKEGIKP